MGLEDQGPQAPEGLAQAYWASRHIAGRPPLRGCVLGEVACCRLTPPDLQRLAMQSLPREERTKHFAGDPAGHSNRARRTQSASVALGSRLRQ